MASENVTELSEATWQDDVVSHGGPVLVDFWAPWCGPCRALAPVVDRVAEQYAGKVKVGKVNVDENQELAAQYGITSIPQLLVFKGGDQPVEKVVGLVDEKQIKSILDRHIG